MSEFEQCKGQSNGSKEDISAKQSQTVLELIENFEHSLSLKDKRPLNQDEESANTSSAKLKRRSFANKKPLARVSLIKSTTLSASFDCGSIQAAKTINRRAAFRKIANPAGKEVWPDNNKVSHFAESDSELPGNFSPRTSLKREKSVSADSLAKIRSGQGSTSGRRMSGDNPGFTVPRELEEKVGVRNETGQMPKVDYKDIRHGSDNTLDHTLFSLRRSTHRENVNTRDCGVEEGFIKPDRKDMFFQRNYKDQSCNQTSPELPEGAIEADSVHQKLFSLDEEMGTYEGKTQKPAERTVSDSAVMHERGSNPRWVTFAGQSSKRPPHIRKLQRTPTPYSGEKHSDEDEEEEEDEGQCSFDAEYGDCLDLPQ